MVEVPILQIYKQHNLTISKIASRNSVTLSCHKDKLLNGAANDEISSNALAPWRNIVQCCYEFEIKCQVREDSHNKATLKLNPHKQQNVCNIS